MSTGNRAAFVFPHQLFLPHPALDPSPARVLLIEDSLFFGDEVYPLKFHRQKLAYHRASMSAYAERLRAEGNDVLYVAHEETRSAIDALCGRVADEGIVEIVVADVHDFELHRRLCRATDRHGLGLTICRTPAFVNDPAENREWRAERNRWFMADYYAWQRRRLDLLMDGDEPLGGKWSHDEANRRKVPKARLASLPVMPEVARCEHVDKAMASVQRDFPDNPGRLDSAWYPVTHEAAEAWLETFLEERFAEFGPYEDAIVRNEPWLFHGVLTPMLNTGLLTPVHVIERAVEVGTSRSVPVNSLEGFVRQIVGWREFMRATYDDLSVPMRTTNHWQHKRRLPASFWTAKTGIDPLDDVIERVLETGYCHHIERLMVVGGFMFLCEIDPDDVYAWFMEMFIDSYDWVMVPNAYAMSQHADGGAITTKPYFSGSNYIRKMSNFGTGDWSAIWDALFWRWIEKHKEELAGNPRWSMMVSNVRRMDADKLAGHLRIAEAYLETLDHEHTVSSTR